MRVYVSGSDSLSINLSVDVNAAKEIRKILDKAMRELCAEIAAEGYKKNHWYVFSGIQDPLERIDEWLKEKGENNGDDL